MGYPMSHSSEDDTDISESELDEYEDIFYEEMRNGKHKVKIADGVFKCPFCSGKKKTYFIYKDILQHTYGVGKGSHTRGVRHKANHLALAKYLEKDLASVNIQSLCLTGRPTPAKCESEVFVWPWVGVIVNISTERVSDGRIVVDGNNVKELLISKRFNPVKVHSLSSPECPSKNFIVEFNKDWSGLYNAISMEKYFETDLGGKNDLRLKKDTRSTMYGWVARDDDFFSGDLVGNHLRKYGDLKTCAEIVAEEKLKKNKTMEKLTFMIDSKNKDLKRIDEELNKTNRLLKIVMDRIGTDINQKLDMKMATQSSSLEISMDNIVEENTNINTVLAPAERKSRSILERALSAKHNTEELFVWPWAGIIVNLPIGSVPDHNVGVNKKLKDQLTEKGFMPLKVHPFSSGEGSAVNVIVEFNKDWSGFYCAMSMEKYFETDHHGKKHWLSKEDNRSGIYGWVARESDCNSGDPMGDHLCKTCDLKNCADIVADEEWKTRQLVTYLANVIGTKNELLEQIGSKLNQANLCLKHLMDQNNIQHQTLNQGANCNSSGFSSTGTNKVACFNPSESSSINSFSNFSEGSHSSEDSTNPSEVSTKDSSYKTGDGSADPSEVSTKGCSSNPSEGSTNPSEISTKGSSANPSEVSTEGSSSNPSEGSTTGPSPSGCVTPSEDNRVPTSLWSQVQ